jgi:hypothetical protein
MESIKIDIHGNISLKEFDNVVELVKSSLINKGFKESDLMSCIIAMSVCNGNVTIPVTVLIGEDNNTS